MQPWVPTGRVMTKAAAPPPTGDYFRWNARLSEGHASDQDRETWFTWAQAYPHSYSFVGTPDTRVGGVTPGFSSGHIYNTAGFTDRRLAGGVGFDSGTTTPRLVLASGEQGHPVGTYRVWLGLGLYVWSDNDRCHIWDGHVWATNTSLDIAYQISGGTTDANEYMHADNSKHLTQASWAAAYDNAHVDVEMTDKGADTALVLGPGPAQIGSLYIGHWAIQYMG